MITTVDVETSWQKTENVAAQKTHPCFDLVSQCRVRHCRHVGVFTDKLVADVKTALQVL